jgi:hypothetical protein
MPGAHPRGVLVFAARVDEHEPLKENCPEHQESEVFSKKAPIATGAFCCRNVKAHGIP